MSIDTPKAIKVFFSYAHEDEKLRDQLAKHLRILEREGVITGWHDRKISAGTDWAGEIDKHLNTARIILLLISVDFLYSDYRYGVELKRAMERHATGEAHVIPVILRPVEWHREPFGNLKPLPLDGKPVTRWQDRDEAFLNIAQGIRAAVEQLMGDELNAQQGVDYTRPSTLKPQPTQQDTNTSSDTDIRTTCSPNPRNSGSLIGGGVVTILALIGGIYIVPKLQLKDLPQTTISPAPSSTLQPKDSPSLISTTFADWCVKKNELSPAQRHTVNVLIEQAGTQDCNLAEKKLSALTKLCLQDKNIEDVAPLSSLKNLEVLNLDPNKIRDVSPLSSLRNLKKLVLSGNDQIKDLSSLSSLPNLTILHLDRNKIDVRQLLSFPNLTELSISQADIENRNLLSSLKKLKTLYLIRINIQDISPLSNLKNLTVLHLNENPIVDVAPLSSLTNLQNLYLMNNNIKDVSPLSNLKNLTHLDLSGNPIANKTCPVPDPQNTICVF